MTKRQKLNKIKDLIGKYKDKLHLKGWEISFELQSDWSKDGAAATADVDYIYRFCKVTVYECSFHKDNNLSHIIKHELVHCITEPLYAYCFDLLNGKLRTPNDIENRREEMTEAISKVIS